MANIMQQFRAKNRVTRDGYDLSKRLCFTAKAGELLPTYSRLMMVGDEFDFSNKWETTTAPVNTSAYTRFKEYFDWYFVPINLLWNRFNGWSTGIKELSSYATSINGSSTLTDDHPFFSTSQIQDYLSELEGNEDYNTNYFGFSRAQNTRKLLSYLGYGDFYNTNTIDDLVLSPWRLLAYQKIYQDFYRNSQWEAFSYERYNLMYLNGQSDSLQIPTNQLDLSRQTMFDLQYANWNKDLFMGVLPSSQYGDAASIDLSSFENIQIQNMSSFPNADVTTTSSSKLQAASVGASWKLVHPDNSSLVSSFTVLALRHAEAMQKFKEITQSNVLDFPSQKEAHFDYRPNEAYSERCRRIGGIDNDIKISAVINNNITKVSDNEVNAANVAGYGHSQKFGNGRKFKADVDGVLMCIYHVVPLLDYALPRVDPDNLKTSFTDYAIPEFDRTGMVQVPFAWMSNNTPSDDPLDNLVLNSRLIGYAPNYIEYKTDIDEVKGAFYNGGLEAWVAPIDNSYFYNFLTKAGRRSLVFNGIDYTWFKINPSITDDIFSGEVSNDNVSSDKFWVNCYHDVSAVRPLDRYGLPY